MIKKLLIASALLAGCTTGKPSWHIELETHIAGKWVQVESTPAYVYAGEYAFISKCRHNVLIQKHVLSDLAGCTKFRYSIGLVYNGVYEPMHYFDSYTEALHFFETKVR